MRLVKRFVSCYGRHLMKLSRDQVRRLARGIVRQLEEGRVRLEAPAEKVAARIEAVVTANLEEEDAIDRQARQYMEKYQGEIGRGAIDPHKMFMMIKKQIAKEKNFIL